MGARSSRGLRWVITLIAVTTEVSNRLTNANGVDESFPNVNVFRILIFGGHYLDRGPAQIW